MNTWQLLLVAADDAALRPTSVGWTIMLASVGSVVTLTFYCLKRVLALPPVEAHEHVKGPLEIDTRDTRDAD